MKSFVMPAGKGCKLLDLQPAEIFKKSKNLVVTLVTTKWFLIEKQFLGC